MYFFQFDSDGVPINIIEVKMNIAVFTNNLIIDQLQKIYWFYQKGNCVMRPSGMKILKGEMEKKLEGQLIEWTTKMGSLLFNKSGSTI